MHAAICGLRSLVFPCLSSNPPAAPLPVFALTQKFRLAVAESLNVQYDFMNKELTGSQSFSPRDGAVEVDPLNSDETDILQSALAGEVSFSSPTLKNPLKRLKGGRGMVGRVLWSSVQMLLHVL
eukprot:1157179-Pelagomonas_calceolata.AAC.9